MDTARSLRKKMRMSSVHIYVKVKKWEFHTLLSDLHQTGNSRMRHMKQTNWATDCLFCIDLRIENRIY